jgi:hypothetical protein
MNVENSLAKLALKKGIHKCIEQQKVMDAK